MIRLSDNRTGGDLSTPYVILEKSRNLRPCLDIMCGAFVVISLESYEVTVDNRELKERVRFFWSGWREFG